VHTALPIITGAIALAEAGVIFSAAARIRRLSERLEFGAQRLAQLQRRNRELSEQKAELQKRHDAYRASRSAAVAKGNRTRSEKFHAARAAKMQQLVDPA